ncbi:MAG: hypothetical protein IPJ34_06080 [Myxococcales bacterium]|nr:hypothetical protein [Myxococcales bacterium]
MSIAGTFPEHGFRVRLERSALEGEGARYRGYAYVPTARFPLVLAISGTGEVALEVGAPENEVGETVVATLPPGDEAFVRQLAKQLHRQAREAPIEQGGGQWARRVQRWRGPK